MFPELRVSAHNDSSPGLMRSTADPCPRATREPQKCSETLWRKGAFWAQQPWLHCSDGGRTDAHAGRDLLRQQASILGSKYLAQVLMAGDEEGKSFVPLIHADGHGLLPLPAVTRLEAGSIRTLSNISFVASHVCLPPSAKPCGSSDGTEVLRLTQRDVLSFQRACDPTPPGLGRKV